jgi:pseudouridine kinase
MQPLLIGIGGANVDLSMASRRAIVPHDSNPARLTLSAGGVMRNICENAARLGVPTELFSAVGSDVLGEFILASCENAHVGTGLVRRFSDSSSSAYVSALDERGEMYVAFSDMTITSRLTPADFDAALPTLHSAGAVCMDGNLTREFLEYAAKKLAADGIPLFFDPVSTTYAEKFVGLLSYFHTAKPNRLELAVLSGMPVTDEASVVAATERLMDLGLQRVFVTLGEEGVYYRDRNGRSRRYHPDVVPMKNATGAGDAFTAGLISSFFDGLSVDDTLRRACACSALAVSAEETVSPHISIAEVEQYPKGGTFL